MDAVPGGPVSAHGSWRQRPLDVCIIDWPLLPCTAERTHLGVIPLLCRLCVAARPFAEVAVPSQ